MQEKRRPITDIELPMDRTTAVSVVGDHGDVVQDVKTTYRRSFASPKVCCEGRWMCTVWIDGVRVPSGHTRCAGCRLFVAVAVVFALLLLVAYPSLTTTILLLPTVVSGRDGLDSDPWRRHPPGAVRRQDDTGREAGVRVGGPGQ